MGTTTLTEFKKGKFEYKADKAGIVHVNFGKSNFTNTQLIENLTALYKSIEQNRPSGVKGKYFKSLFICTTMGSSIKLDLDIFEDLKTLTLLEASQLITKIEETFNVDASASV